MENNELRQTIADFGLGDIANKLCQLALPAITVKTSDDEPEFGYSRLGGIPDLPETIQWPQKDGEHYLFVGQINLSELPQAIPDFPQTGWLFFFVGLDEPAYDVEHKVFHYEGRLDDLRPVSPPTEESVNPDYGKVFTPVKLTFGTATSIPDLSEDPSYDDYYDDLCQLQQELIFPGECRLFGYPETWNGNPAVDAQLCANGFKEHIFDTHKSLADAEKEVSESLENGDEGIIEYRKKWFESFKGFVKEKDEQIAQAKNWQVLFQVSSVDEANMCWWDAGLLTFMIDTTHLKKGDFYHTYACIQSS